jgi:hypothetical protein
VKNEAAAAADVSQMIPKAAAMLPSVLFRRAIRRNSLQFLGAVNDDMNHHFISPQ